MARICSKPDCQESHVARGFCYRHHREFLRAGGERVATPTRHYGKTPEERFWLYVDKKYGCWEWTGYKNAKGYGVINLRGERVMAHRFAYQLEAPIPDGMFVLHHCDNPACVRFKHLFLGTLAENNADMDSKGRDRRVGGMPGTKNPAAKLTEDDVREIRASNESSEALAVQYGIDRVNIWAARSGKTWKHVP